MKMPEIRSHESSFRCVLFHLLLTVTTKICTVSIWDVKQRLGIDFTNHDAGGHILVGGSHVYIYVYVYIYTSNRIRGMEEEKLIAVDGITHELARLRVVSPYCQYTPPLQRGPGHTCCLLHHTHLICLV